jgi:hypothetical protein
VLRLLVGVELLRISNWCKKLSAALIAGGLLAPSALNAATLNTNLVANSGFEDVDTGVTCCFGAVKINGWADGSQTGFAYNYSLGYDNGGPLAGGGNFYFTSNGDGDVGAAGDVTNPGQVAQRIDLSTGDTAASIATGQATFQLSAFFSSYLDQGDFGSVRVEFLDASLSPVGTAAVISDNNTATWSQVSTTGPIPSTTFEARVSVFGTPLTGGPDGYIDNLDFRVVPEPATEWLCSLGFVAAGFMLRRRRSE